MHQNPASSSRFSLSHPTSRRPYKHSQVLELPHLLNALLLSVPAQWDFFIFLTLVVCANDVGNGHPVGKLEDQGYLPNFHCY